MMSHTFYDVTMEATLKKYRQRSVKFMLYENNELHI